MAPKPKLFVLERRLQEQGHNPPWKTQEKQQAFYEEVLG
jgi:hypothetical protein